MKLSDNRDLMDFIENSPASTLAVPLDYDGSVHVAPMVFYNTFEPLDFYFVTARDSVKFTMLHTHSQINAALVVGTEKDTPYSVQMRGTLEEVDPDENKKIIDDYYEKRGNRNDPVDDPENCLIKFTPTWARYTDYSEGYDKYELDLK
jgi:general stress protein 26